MIRFSWATKTPKQKIAELPERSERRRARAALRHLLDDDANAYRKFHEDHQKFLDLHDGEVSEAVAKRPLHFIEELGLECAVWPALYWKTSMCETHERYTDPRRLEREHDEAELQDVEGADGQRHSAKRSFRAKLMGPLLGYGSNFALLQFVYDLQLRSELGAKRNIAERQGGKTRLMMAQHPMSPLYWRAVLAGLQDLVRQIGPPQLYWTFAPWELSFPYSEFLLDELRKQLRARYGAPAHETLHITHCMLEAVRGFMAGGAGALDDKAKWSRFLLQGQDAQGKPAGCFHFFTRLEFQDGSKKAGTQRYHGSGRPHLHVLFWLDCPEQIDWEQRALAECPADNAPNLAGFVRGSQEDREGESRWPVCEERSKWDPAADRLQLHHPAEAAKAGLRAYFPDLMDCFRCHQDLQASDGHHLLLTYVAKYVAKWSDSSFQEWMSDSATANSLARKVLFEYHPLEPEMVLQLCGNYRQWDMGTNSGGKRDLVAPKLGAEPPKHLQQYMDNACRSDDLSFLDFLRKSTSDGDIAQWVKRAYKALPEDHPGWAPTLSEFANKTAACGQIAVAAQYVWRLNDAFYGQWLLMNVPFRELQEFEFQELEERVPRRYHGFAAALLTTDRKPCLADRLRSFWRNPAAMEHDMIAEGISEKVRGDFLRFAAAHVEAIDSYLAGRPKDLQRFVFQGHQALLAQQIEERVATASRARSAALEADAQAARDSAGMAAHRPIVCLGEPGTGKSTVLRAQVERVLEQGGQVLCALPTAQFAARSRAKLPEHENLVVDTHTAAFQLHLPEQETVHALHGVDLIVVDEVQQLGAADFERILRLWRHAERAPALVFLGDKYQLPGVAPVRPWESTAWQRNSVLFMKLTEVHRCKDPAFLEKLRALRVSQPSQILLRDLCRGHKAWHGEEPSW